MADHQKRLFCFGLGYSALGTAQKLAGLGWQIAGTSRDPAKCRSMTGLGIDAQVFAPGQALTRPEVFLTADAVLTSIAPDGSGDPVLAAYSAELRAHRAWLGYLSTTGVYGDAQGAWVDESAERRATSPRGRARILAEDEWMGLGAHIFRLAGIYGPSRSQIDSLRNGTAKRLVKPGQVFSRIHVEDIAAVVCASIARPAPGRAYNVADDEPAPPQDVVAYAAGLMGIDPPPEQDFEAAASSLSEMARSFYADNKRIDNKRIKTELGVSLTYPTYREGLSACLSASGP
jgi:nucleoside-diphosphate-sugar epimerase